MIVWAGAEGGSPDAPGGFATSDVFEESFAAITDRNFAGVATRVRATAAGASNAVGYYFNDIPIWERPAPGGAGPPAWTGFMRSLNATAAGKAAYVGWLHGRYGGTASGLAEVCRVYSIVPAVTTWEALLACPFGSVDRKRCFWHRRRARRRPRRRTSWR